MLYAKCKYDCDVIINKCFRVYDLKSNGRYIYELHYDAIVFFIKNFSLKLYLHLQKMCMQCLYHVNV